MVATDLPIEDTDSWTAVIPIKARDFAKRRLARPDRGALAAAFAEDTLHACLASELVSQVVVVSPHPLFVAERVSHVADPGRGLNAAIRAGLRALPPGTAAVALVSDLPCLSPTELDRVLTAGRKLLSRSPSVVVPDRGGTGTTMLLGRAPGPEPHFGRDSLRRHRAAGAAVLASDADQAVRLDVDNEADLRAAIALGVGAATRQVLEAGTAAPMT